MRKKMTLFGFTLAALMLAAGPAFAGGPDADEILKKMDRKINGHADQEMDVTMTIYDSDGSQKSYKFTIKQKGDEKRLVRFTSGEAKGMSILTQDQSRMYVYLPGYKRVRPIAAHNMNQAFMGSDFTNADMAAVSWPKLYKAKLLKEDDKFYHLELTPKSKDAAYPKAVMMVGKKDWLQWGTDYYNEKGEIIKKFRSSKLKKFEGVDVEWHSLIEMSDPRTGHRTTLEIRELKLDQGLKDSIFTTRHLQWSR